MDQNVRKKLLVLGGGIAAKNVVAEAKKMGLYVIAVDNLPSGCAKEIADKDYQISTTDMAGLEQIVKKEQVQGVFCGPSEFNIINTMRLCEKTGLPFYATREQWNLCSNKLAFKQLCRKFGVPCVEEYNKEQQYIDNFPVIVKPADGNSSKGITVCWKKEELEKACQKAGKCSESNRIIVEKYIDNPCGAGVNVRYVADNEKVHFVLAGDTYTVDPYKHTSLINAVGIYPSKYTQFYIDHVDGNVKRMADFLQLKNCSFFLQAVVGDHIYFHEMGLRLSGGLLYELIEPLTNVNDMKMMIRYAVGEKFASKEELDHIDPFLKGKKACIFNIPLNTGKISKIDGIDKIKEKIQLQSFEQYYREGDVIKEQYIGTIQQHLGRFKFICDSDAEIVEKIRLIQETLKIEDHSGNNMIYRYFDTDRI